MKKRWLWLGGFVVAAFAIAGFFFRPCAPPVIDDAKAAGKTVADLPETASHAFDVMDGGIALTEEETKGRNTWLLWTAGDQTFWDRMARQAGSVAAGQGHDG